MSFSSKSSVDLFYSAMGQPTATFKREIESKFLPELKKPFLQGGASTHARKKVIQEAVDALQCYGELNLSDAAGKRMVFETAYRDAFKGGLPPNTPHVRHPAARMKQIAAKYHILEDKIALLNYWRSVNETYDPKLSDKEAPVWRSHYLFAACPPAKVKPILQILINDAREVMDMPALSPLVVKTWAGKEVSFNKQFLVTDISRTLKVEVTARAGFQGNAHMELEYRGLKAELNGEYFAGGRAKLAGNVDIRPGSFNAQGNLEVEVGVVIKGDAKFNIMDLLEVSADAEALAGAQLKAEGKISVNYEGVEVLLDAEAFAGVRIKGSASGKLTLGGREITSVKVEGQAWAGAGAKGKLGFKCSVFGDVQFEIGAGAAAGVGGSGSINASLNPMAIRYGALQLVWIYASEHGIKNQGRAFFIPQEENAKMGDLTENAIGAMMMELYQQNETEIKRLQRWGLVKQRHVGSVLVGA